MVHNQFDTLTSEVDSGKIGCSIKPLRRSRAMAARTNMPVDDRLAIVNQMLSPRRQYGEATALAQQYEISRQMIYYLEEKAESALKAALTPTSGPLAMGCSIAVTRVRLERAVTLLEWVGVSERDSTWVLEEMLDTRRSLGYVVKVRQAAEALATVRNAEVKPRPSGLMAADEIFLHEQPILGVVHPASLYLAGLNLREQCDGETWGCQFLEGEQCDGIISDAGSGLAAGAELAQMGCHVGDWFHPLLLAGLVETQLERRAYAALAEQYGREEKLRQAHTCKRWENHWQQYVRACAEADQAIEHYDQWRVLRLDLRAAAAQFDWITGQVRLPAQVKAELQRLATAFAHWADGTQAKNLVSLLCQQTEALTTALPHLQQALIPLQAAWGEEATRVVCRLGQALREWAFPFWRPDQRRLLEQAISETLTWASAHLRDHLSTLQHLVAAILAQWPRTSSSIECLNSLLRPYLNGRKQVSQGFLELFRFFHNTHRFVRGQRAGFSPLELAGGPHVDDPLAFLSLGAKS
jgi:hypothetical protein